jgi:hypothetical protein
MITLPILGQLVLNEILYDPPGADAGREFVEILNVGDAPVGLDSFELQAGDGAHPGTWRTAWRGSVETIAPSALFVIGGDSVAARNARLGAVLQNGPDAVRLVERGRVIDRVGYGALQDPGLFEGRPAVDLPDVSLARIPDGRDTDDNAADFQAALPTPGRRNAPRREWRVSLAEPEWTRLWPGRRLRVTARVHNTGLDALAADAWQGQGVLFPLQGEPYLDGLMRGSAVHLEATCPALTLAPRDSTACELGWTGELGLFELAFAARGADEDSTDDTRRIVLRVGAGAVLVNEILFAPAAGAPEWVELLNRDARAHDLNRWTLADATGRRATLRAARPLEPAAIAVISADTAAAIPALGPGVLRAAATAWPDLNNTDGDEGWADLLVLRDPAGIVQDAITYKAEWGRARGRSIERLTRDPDAHGLVWAACKDPSGSTPGRPNSATAPSAPGADLVLEPNPFSPDGDGREDLLGVRFEVPAGHEGFRASVYDLGGHRLRTLAADRLGPGPRQLVWDGSADDGTRLVSGAYIFHLELLGKARTSRVLRTVGLVRP